MELPNTLLTDIAVHFDLHQNYHYRRVSQNWQLVLSRVFKTNHLAVSLGKIQRRNHWLQVTSDVFRSYYVDFPKTIEEWFSAQASAQRSRGVLIFGIGETFVGQTDVCDRLVEAIKEHSAATGSSPRFLLWSNIRLSAWDVLNLHIPSRIRPTEKPLPPACRIILKDCWLTGADWIRLLPNENRLIKTLFSIYIPEMEHVSLGHLCKGHRQVMVYRYGEGEAEAFATELLRLGRKYVAPLTVAERHELDTLFHYYYLSTQHLHDFEELTDNLIRAHETEPHQAGLLPEPLVQLYRNYTTVWKLKPLTERLLLALFTDPHYV